MKIVSEVFSSCDFLAVLTFARRSEQGLVLDQPGKENVRDPVSPVDLFSEAADTVTDQRKLHQLDVWPFRVAIR